ncbi:hypothetical protein Q3G72_025531 [Acer saccharum]|nr:hypothetical protein Q3G72_025531 [Acer saccharum]
MLKSSGIVKSNKSDNFVSASSKRGLKRINQDCALVWETWTMGTCCGQKGQEISAFFFVCNWQEALTSSTTSVGMDADMGLDRNVDVWRQSCLKTYASIDQELKQNTKIDSFRSGTTALTIVKQGENLIAANVGDSRAVLATLSDDGSLIPLQLTINSRPNLLGMRCDIQPRSSGGCTFNARCTIRAWKYKKRGITIAMDDISAICLFFHSTSPRGEARMLL